MKNILVWLRIALLVLLICTITGNITADTPIFGKIVYPLFAPIIDEVNNIINEREISGLMDFLTIAISVLVSLSMFTLKVKNISQNDIKSDKLKIALIQANLYFNTDGKLVRRVERMTQTDLNGDEEIAETGEPAAPRGLIRGTVSAIKEFFIIATTDLSDDDQDENFEKAKEEAGLVDTEEVLNEIDNETKSGTANYADDKAIRKIDKEIERIKNDHTLSSDQKTERIASLQKTKEKLQSRKDARARRKHEKLLKKEDKVEIIENNLESSYSSNSSTEAESVIKEETKEVSISENENKQPEKTTQTETVNSFLKRLKGGK